jgi:hypothetical protein
MRDARLKGSRSIVNAEGLALHRERMRLTGSIGARAFQASGVLAAN